eukprot:694537-Prymnesium_polylepis.1
MYPAWRRRASGDHVRRAHLGSRWATACPQFKHAVCAGEAARQAARAATRAERANMRIQTDAE